MPPGAFMKNFLLGVIATLAVSFLAALVFLCMGFAEVRADVSPSRWETAIFTAAAHASIRRSAPAASNPFPPTDENLIAGGKEYLGNCSGCHGSHEKPDRASAASLFPPIPQFAETGTPLSESQIFWVAKHGIRRTGMFANGKFYSDDRLWKMAGFVFRIKSLPAEVQAALSSKK
jgi:mono/diheme cytochrome c family protein